MVQELLEHSDVSTTMIYTHVLKVAAGGTASPLNSLAFGVWLATDRRHWALCLNDFSGSASDGHTLFGMVRFQPKPAVHISEQRFQNDPLAILVIHLRDRVRPLAVQIIKQRRRSDHARSDPAQSGTTAVTSISTNARSSTRSATCTRVMAG